MYEKKNGSVRIAAEWIRDGETLLAFVTPEWAAAVERLLKTLSEHGFTVLTDDLDKHGIP